MTNDKKTNTKTFTQSGFTLIELSIVIIIMGVIMVPLVNLYTGYLRQEKLNTTRDNISKMMVSLGVYSPIRYPCPSDRSLAPGDPNYGKDVCTITGFTLAGIPNCNTTGAEQGICKAPGARDTLDDTDTTVGNNNELVLIGGVPISSSGKNIDGITFANSMDGWNKKLSYAVSYTSSRPNRTKGFDRYKNGVIRVIDEFDRDTAGSKSDAQFVVYSSGDTGKGAFNNVGMFTACDVSTKEGGNCNGDSTFVQAIGNSDGAGVNFYDDRLMAKTAMNNDLWFNVTDGTAANLPTNHMKPFFTGAVGVNKKDPGTSLPAGVSKLMLDVGGTVKAGAIRTDALCNNNGTACLNTDYTNGFFSQRSANNDCGDGMVMTGISGGVVQCAFPAITPGVGAAVDCPAGTWVRGILTDRSVLCSNGVTCPGGTGCL